MPEREGPAVGLGLPHQDPQEARLPGAVEPQHQQALCAAEVEAHVLEDRRTPVGLRQTVGHQDRPTAVRWVGEPEPDALLLRGPLDALRLQLRHTRVERLRLPSPLGGLSAHRIGEGPQPLDLVLLAIRELAEPDLVQTPRLPVLAVGAPVLDDAVAIQMQDPGDRRVQQGEVVTHHDERTLVRRQELHQPGLRVDVEVVRGLIEQEQIRSSEQDPAELEPTPFPTRERPHGEREPVLREPQPGGDRLRVRLCLVATELAVLLFEACEPVDLTFAVRLLERDPCLLQAPVQVDEAARPEDVLEPAILVLGAVLPRVLAEVTDRAPADDRATCRRDLAREHPERRRFPGAVAPDDADRVAVPQIDAEPPDDDATADLDGQLASLERDHGALP